MMIYCLVTTFSSYIGLQGLGHLIWRKHFFAGSENAPIPNKVLTHAITLAEEVQERGFPKLKRSKMKEKTMGNDVNEEDEIDALSSYLINQKKEKKTKKKSKTSSEKDTKKEESNMEKEETTKVEEKVINDGHLEF